MSSPLDRLRVTGDDLPPELRDEILALGKSAVPDLIAILLDEDLGALHAVDLLATLKASEAVEPMLRVLRTIDPEAELHGRITIRISAMGAPVLEPTLALLAETDDYDLRQSCGQILTEIGIRDERILSALRGLFEDDLVLGAALFADYGDQRALPWLRSAMLDYKPNFGSVLWQIDVRELTDAYKRLGGDFDEELQAWTLALAEQPHSAKVGRNDPCPCGSGKKYKKCCGFGAPETTT